MSEPTMPLGDPTAVILARMEVKLDNALAEQSRHGAIIDRHDRTLGEHGNRITILETQSQTTAAHEDARLTGKAVFWGSVAALAMVASVIITLLLSHRGG